jgi:hypothetical protein
VAVKDTNNSTGQYAISTSKPFEMLLVLIVISVGLWGCESNDQSKKTTEIPESIEFTVDGDTVYYRWREPDGTMTTAQSLGGIPLAARPAVAVFVSGKTAGTTWQTYWSRSRGIPSQRLAGNQSG